MKEIDKLRTENGLLRAQLEIALKALSTTHENEAALRDVLMSIDKTRLRIGSDLATRVATKTLRDFESAMALVDTQAEQLLVAMMGVNAIIVGLAQTEALSDISGEPKAVAATLAAMVSSFMTIRAGGELGTLR